MNFHGLKNFKSFYYIFVYFSPSFSLSIFLLFFYISILIESDAKIFTLYRRTHSRVQLKTRLTGWREWILEKFSRNSVHRRATLLALRFRVKRNVQITRGSIEFKTGRDAHGLALVKKYGAGDVPRW